MPHKIAMNRAPGGATATIPTPAAPLTTELARADAPSHATKIPSACAEGSRTLSPARTPAPHPAGRTSTRPRARSSTSPPYPGSPGPVSPGPKLQGHDAGIPATDETLQDSGAVRQAEPMFMPRDTDALAAEIANLERLDLAGLRSAWRARFGPPPKLRSATFLRLCLAWRLQAFHYGGLGPALRRQLRNRDAANGEHQNLSVGTRLHREWQGKVMEVVVADDGFHWDGKVFRSLSAVATAIAGSRWNGPRFFGLRQTR